MTPVPLKTIFKEKPLWLLVLLGILYFYRPLFLGETFFFRDLFSIFLTQKQLFLNLVQSGELPLWDSYLHGGRPYFANALNSTFYPTNLLLCILPFFHAFNLTIVLHVLGYLVFTYIFARTIGLQPLASVAVAMVYGFCGYTLSLINLLNMFMAMMYLPVLLLCWHLFLLRKRSRWFIVTVLAGMIQIFAGSPEITILSGISLFGWSVWYPYPVTPGRRIILWALLGCCISGVAAIQIVPLGELLVHSSRRYGLSYAAWSQWSLVPQRLPELFFSEFFGHVDTMNWAQNYWGSAIAPEKIPFILSIYVGGVAFTLAILGGIYSGEQPALPRKTRRFLVSVFICSVTLSLGRFLPLSHFIYQYMPFANIFRYPIKLFSVGLFPFALLVGYATDLYFGKYPHDRRPIIPSARLVGLFWGISALLIGFTLVFLFSEDVAYFIQKRLFSRADNVAYHGLRTSFLHATAVWIVVTLLYHARRLRKTRWQGWMLAGILVVDLFVGGKRVNSYAPREIFTDIPEIIRVIQQEMGDGRLFRFQSSDQHAGFLQIPDDMSWMYRWTLETLDNSSAAFFQIPVIFHIDFDRMAPAYVMQLKMAIDSLPWERRLPLLSAGGVTLIVSPVPLDLPDLEFLGNVPNRGNLPFYRYRNSRTADRVTFVTQWKEVETDPDALGIMLNSDYDPRKHVVLQHPESTIAMFLVPKQPADEIASIAVNIEFTHDLPTFEGSPEPCEAAQIISQEASSTVSHLSVTTQCDGYLVFSEPYYPGWRVSIDRKQIPVLRANYAFSAVFLPAGEHEVTRWYHPDSLIIGAVCSASFCGVLFLIIYTGWLSKLL